MITAMSAPWGRMITHDGRMSDEDLLRLPDDGRMYELVEGNLVRMLPCGGGASSLGMDIGVVIYLFVRDHGLGRVTMADGEYKLSRAGEKVTSLAPDIAFVRAERVPPRQSPVYDRAWPLAPDLAVEVAAPRQYRPKMAAKARIYLQAGVRLVWIVWPKRQQIDVWLPGDTKPTRTLSRGDELDGMDVLPGFRCPLDRIFP